MGAGLDVYMVEDDSFGKLFIGFPRMDFFGNRLTRCGNSRSIWLNSSFVVGWSSCEVTGW